MKRNYTFIKKNYTTTFSILLLLTTLLGTWNTCAAQTNWTQLGDDMDGEGAADMSGNTVSMPDAHTIAIGAPKNSSEKGHVRIYKWANGKWTPKGDDIDGEYNGDLLGTSVSMPDANTIAIGAPKNSSGKGYVRIYKWVNGKWSPKGDNIDGEYNGDLSGTSVSMPDANTVAIGAPKNGGRKGHIRIYKWTGTKWSPKGNDIDGKNRGDLFGTSVSMPDANTVAIGATLAGNGKGYTRIYKWTGTAWSPKGDALIGETTGDLFGTSVSMPDANTVAIGAPQYARGKGHVRIYKWANGKWSKKGTNINGLSNIHHQDLSGTSVSMPDANTIAIGSPGSCYRGHGFNSGQVRVFKWNGNDWKQDGLSINGESPSDESGTSVSMPTPSTVGIGAPLNDGGKKRSNGNIFSGARFFFSGDRGHVRVFGPGSSLPIVLSEFTVNCSNGIVNFYWRTESEINNDFFTIEKSIDAIEWTAELTHSGAGNSNYPIDYSATGENTTDGTQYYRLKQTDFDGKTSYSKIVAVQCSENPTIKMYPNPVKNTLNIEGLSSVSELRLINIAGAEIMTTTNMNEFTQLDVHELKPGIYFVHIIDKNGVVSTQKITKQ